MKMRLTKILTYNFIATLALSIYDQSLASQKTDIAPIVHDAPIKLFSDQLKVNTDIDIATFNQEVSSLCTGLKKHYDENPLSIENYKKTLSTIKTFAFLYLYSNDLSQINTLNKKFIISNRIDELYKDLDTLDIPDCPELFDDVTPERITFEKIRFYLFEPADFELQTIFLSHMNDGIPFAFPIIEWAVNIIPLFEYEFFLEEASLEKEKLKNFIKINFAQEQVTQYFKMGWIELIKATKKGLNSSLINTLRCDMCYPARVSIIG